MKFTDPYFLFGLCAILIPVIIHLFNFRRYKTAYFSNVKLLQEIVLKTRRESRLQHLIVLFLRIAGIAALVFAFARPYIPLREQHAAEGKLVAIFLDNSYSMEANSKEGVLIQEAADAAKSIISLFSYTDDYILVTNDFSARESKILNKDEVIDLLDDMEISLNSRTISEIIAFQDHVASRSVNKERINYFISDFQKTQFHLEQPNIFPPSSYLLKLPATQTNNISVDTCWFDTPVFNLGQQVTLTVRISNHGDRDVMKLPVKLHVNEQQRALAAVDLKANSYADCNMQYNITTTGVQKGVIQLDDTPIVFDDELYFVYEVKSSNPVLAITKKGANNRYLRALYARDSLFMYTEMQEDQVNYSQFANTRLIILDELQDLSSGLSEELQSFVSQGGSLLIFPPEDSLKPAWNIFLSNMGVPGYGKEVAQPLKVDRLNVESVYFRGSINKLEQQMDMPQILKYREINRSGTVAENILMLENSAPLLSVYNVGKGKVYLSAVALNDHFGQAHKHALFFVPLHNIGIMNLIQDQLYYQVGKSDRVVIDGKSTRSEELFVMHLAHGDYEFIPGQRAIGRETHLYLYDQIKLPGFYEIKKGEELVSVIACNISRKESALDYYAGNDLEDIAKIGEPPFSVLEINNKNLPEQLTRVMTGKPLWRYFVITALLCFLAEILLLRFWGRARVE